MVFSGGAGDVVLVKPVHQRIERKRRCLLVMGVVMVATIIVIITFLTVFKARDAAVQITTIALPTFTVHASALNATLELAIAVHNPNRERFRHSESVSRLFYYGDPVGRAALPEGNIEAGGDESYAVALKVEPGGRRVVVSPENIVSGLVPLVATTTIAGVVRVLGVFEHHAVTASHCEVVVFVANATIQSFICRHGMKL